MYKKSNKKYTANKTLKIINVNIQSLSNKVNQINLLLQNVKVQVMCLTEHWVSEENMSNINFTDYLIAASFCRKQYIHGGVLLLVNQNVPTKPLNISSYSIEKHIEICGIQLPEEKSLIVAVYRSPVGNEDIFFETIGIVLDSLLTNYPRHKIYLVGDYNINILQDTKTSENLIGVMVEHNLHHIFTEPSRITSATSTCIDNIFTNTSPEDCEARTINFHLADHHGQLLTVFANQPEKRKEVIHGRTVNNENIENFKSLLDSVNWNIVYSDTLSSSEAYANFHGILMECFDKA